MKRLYVVALAVMACLGSLSSTACAQDQDAIVARVPFEFVAGARTMPSGVYSIARLTHDAHTGIAITSRDKSALVLPVAVDQASPQHTAALDFEHVGDKYILSGIQTLDRTYVTAAPRRLATIVQVNGNANATAGGTN
jgi:hypothetical protein